MKVALFIERFSPARGGRERSTAEIAEGLVKRGCEVDVVCMSGQADLAGVNVLQLGSAGLGRTHRFRRFVRAARRRMAAAADVADEPVAGPAGEAGSPHHGR